MDEKRTDDKLQSLIIGALLHDIGKLLQRSGGIFFNEEEFKNKKMSHSAYGYGFIKKIMLEDPWGVAKCVLYHHRNKIENSKHDLKQNDIAYIVYEADNIAAGSDRRADDDVLDHKENNRVLWDKEVALHSIFNLIKTTNEVDGKVRGHYLRTLKEDENINYPVEIENCKAVKNFYQSIENHLHNNLKEIKIEKQTINSLLQMLEATSCFIPSDTYRDNIPDISLYDHLKITAVVASCIYKYLKDVEKTDNYEKYCYLDAEKNRNTQYYLLVSGDLSGVQDFIYTISSKGALKSLRARSFYLDLLLEHIADEILEKLELSRANLLYTGGGHCYMILPNTPETKQVVDQAKVSANEWFLNNFGTELYLAMDYEPCSSLELMDPPDAKGERHGLTRDVFRRVSERLSGDKLRRYSPEQLKHILNPDSDYNKMMKNNRECSVCHTSKLDIKEREFTEDSCEHCFNFFKMGKELVYKNNETPEKVKMMTIRYEKPERDKPHLELPTIDRSSDSKRYLILEEYWMVQKGLEDNPHKYHRIYTKNVWTAGLKMSTNLWMGDYNKEPEICKDSLIEFKELAQKAKGIKRLAVLRADVDNLGSVFVSGLDKKVGTLSRYATLSRQLTMFFKHHINQICKSNIDGVSGSIENNFNISNLTDVKGTNKNIVIVYSGGDDVFVVGAWNEVIDFAVDLRRAFKMYTANKLNFSAGIGFFHESFPVYQMANITEKLEKLAKNQENKNSLALFGIDKSVTAHGVSVEPYNVYSWDDFEKEVYPKLKYLIDNFEVNREFELSTGFLYKLLNLLEEDLVQDKYSINLARLAYTMARLESRTKNETKQAKYKDLKEKIYSWASQKKTRKELLTAINLLIYLYRDKTKVEVTQ
jgi:CRISPR-associated protein Csm1